MTDSGWRWAVPAPRRLCGPASWPWRTSRQRRAASPGWDFSIPSSTGIGAGSAYQSDLHDIVTGNNSGFNALPGYDLATGWGTPAGQPLIDSLTGVANSAGFNLSVSASTLSIAPGASGVSTITVGAQQGFSSAVNLTVSGLPAGVTGSFSPASAITTSTLTLIASSSAAAGTSTITITGTSGSLTGTARMALTVTAAPGFTISATPANLSLATGGYSTSKIAVSPLNGFTGPVSLAASGLPSGVTASFSAASAGSSTLTLHASSSVAVGASSITVTGTSGSLQSTATIHLTVGASTAFTIASAAASLSVPQNGSGASTITVTPQDSFSGTVALSVTGLPAGVTASFSPASLSVATAARTTNLTLHAVASAALGTSNVTVTGSSGAATSSATIAITVGAPASFTLSATPASLSLMAGTNGASTIALNSQNGFNGTVALAVSGLPAGVTATFGTVTPAHSGAVTFTAASSAAAASATVTITGTSGASTSRTAVALTITRPPTFALSASPSALSIPQGATGTSILTLTPQNGFTNTVTLGFSSLPTGVAGSFSLGATPASCILTLAVTGSAATGRSTVIITGKSGSLSETVAITLTVPPPSGASAGVNLAAAYNVMGVVTDGAVFLSGSGLDGGGRAYSENLLGTVQTAGGAAYNFGSPNAPGAVSGATIALPAGAYSTLKLLATGVNGNQVSQTFTVSYTDGTTAEFIQSLSDWCTPQGYTGESKAILMSYRDNSNGARDTRPVALYGYTFNLSNTKTVKTITLPNNRNVVVLAMNLSAATSSASAIRPITAHSINKTHIVLYPAANRAKR